MAWINVMAERWSDRRRVQQLASVVDVVRGHRYDLAFHLLRIGSYQDLLSSANQIHEDADSVIDDLRCKDLGPYVASEEIIGPLILSAALGIDRSGDLERFLGFESAADEKGRAHIAALRRLFEPRRRKTPKRPLSSYAGTKRALLRRIDTLPTADALDLCNSPGSPCYGWTKGLILPFAYVLAVERGKDLTVKSLAELLGNGAYPERRGTLLFDCSVEPPASGSVEDETDPATWYPFTAVERREDELVAYSWIGFVKGRLVFEDESDSDGFWMLTPARIARAWKLVERRVDEDSFNRIREDIARGREKHVLVADTTLVEVVDREVDRAAEAYAIDLTVKHMFDV